MTKDSKAKKHPSLEEQIAHLTQALQLERADAINLRRRHEEQIQGLKATIAARVVQELLPVIDNLERSLKHAPAELANHDYVKGVQGIVKQFEKALHDLGVSRIKTVGHPFDPRYHEAMSLDESDGGTQETISEELEAGYMLGDQVLRHARVRVKLQ